MSWFSKRGDKVKQRRGWERGRRIRVSFPKLSAMIFKIPYASYQDRYKFVFVKSGKPSGPLLPELILVSVALSDWEYCYSSWMGC